MRKKHKTCTICKENKTLKEFNKKNSAKDGLQPHCRECGRQRSKAYYKRNPTNHKKAVRLRNQRVRGENHYWVLEYLTKHPCVDCGENDPVVLEFDHISGKNAAISDMIQSYYSLSTIKKEVKLCEVRCANCHRRKTARTLGWYRHIYSQEG